MKGQAQLMASARSKGDREAGSTDAWGTPQRFFDLLHEEFSFTLDPCADANNAKCAYFDAADDGLAQDWGRDFCFVNFPYSQAKAWSAKCIAAASAGAKVVVLCAARTDTGWWQNLASVAYEVRFVLGRLVFVRSDEDLVAATQKWFSKRKLGYSVGQFEEKYEELRRQGATFPSSVIVLLPHLVQGLDVDEDGKGRPYLSLWDVGEARR